MILPALRNDREAGETLPLLEVLIAAAVVWALPFGLALLGVAADMLVFRQGGAATALTARSVLLGALPIVSWTLLVVVALAVFGLIRAGWGGLLPALGLGAATGLAAALSFGQPTVAGAGLGLAHTGLLWLILRLHRPGAFT